MEQQPHPRFANDMGVKTIRVATKQFTCIGARPPFDHPHIYLEMGEADEMVCPYCSTRFVYDSTLKGTADPAESLYP